METVLEDFISPDFFETIKKDHLTISQQDDGFIKSSRCKARKN